MKPSKIKGLCLFSPYFYTILAVKIGQRCNIKPKIQVSITDVHNQSESESVRLD